jgi:S1/P1 Nuclease
MNPIRLLCALCAFSGFSYSALAWNAEGHMLVAQIAYNHLDPAVKAKCDALVAVPLTYQKSSSSNFVTAACWADDFKSQLGTATSHYIDLAFSLDGTSTNGVGPENPNVVTAINAAVATLRNASANQTDQATSLRYLLHFVGDIQQPLHCSTAVFASQPTGDAGGNGFRTTGSWSNLHSLWDSGGGFLTDSLPRPLTGTGQNTLTAKVAAIEADYPYTPNAGAIPDPMNWAIEGQGVAETVAYVGITYNTAPSAAYLSTAQSTTEQRMAAGGHRLADLLTTLFAASPINLTCLVQASGDFGFAWNAVSGQTYHVQWKQDLGDSDWQDLTDVTATTNSAMFSEPPAVSHRFYRVVQ